MNKNQSKLFEIFPFLKKSKAGNWRKNGAKLGVGGIAQIIWLLENGNTAAQVTRTTGFARKTVDKYKKEYQGDPTLNGLFEKKAKEKGTGIHTDPEKVEFFRELLKNCPGMTLEGMKLRHNLVFEDSISRSMVYYILKQHLNFSHKKIVPIEYARTNQEIID